MLGLEGIILQVENRGGWLKEESGGRLMAFKYPRMPLAVGKSEDYLKENRSNMKSDGQEEDFTRGVLYSLYSTSKVKCDVEGVKIKDKRRKIQDRTGACRWLYGSKGGGVGGTRAAV